jgi:hypothetical protein
VSSLDLLTNSAAPNRERARVRFASQAPFWQSSGVGAPSSSKSDDASTPALPGNKQVMQSVQ